MDIRLNWMLVRVLRPGERAGELDERVREMVHGCVRCSGIYEALGLVPMYCPVCGTRGEGFVQQVEQVETWPGQEGAGA